MSEPDKSNDASPPQPPRPENGGAAGGGMGPEREASFLALVSTLAMQATIQLGLVQHPLAKKVTKDLRQAKMAIDMIAMLERKTKGNLTAEETQVLGHLLADLRMKYVQAVK